MDYAKPFAKVGKATFTVTLKDTEYSKTFEVSVKAADKTALNNAIAAAEKLTEDKYESGWDAFRPPSTLRRRSPPTRTRLPPRWLTRLPRCRPPGRLW